MMRERVYSKEIGWILLEYMSTDALCTQRRPSFIMAATMSVIDQESKAVLALF